MAEGSSSVGSSSLNVTNSFSITHTSLIRVTSLSDRASTDCTCIASASYSLNVFCCM